MEQAVEQAAWWMMKQDPADGPKYEHFYDEINWTAGVGQPAGVYWLDGRSRIAAHDSLAEAYLLAQGAILMATLRFDRDPLESGHSGRHVERLSARRARADFLRSGVN